MKSMENQSLSSGSNKAIEEVIMAVVKQLKKPSMYLKMFDGSPLEYYRFCRQFDCKIAAHCDSDE